MKYIKVGNVNLACFSNAEVKRIPNVCLGRKGNIITSRLLTEDKRLSNYVNENTSGALPPYTKGWNSLPLIHI